MDRAFGACHRRRKMLKLLEEAIPCAGPDARHQFGESARPIRAGDLSFPPACLYSAWVACGSALFIALSSLPTAC